MLKNFVVDADLVRYFPKIANYLNSNQSDYSAQRTEAFNIVLDDIRAREIEARTLMIPLDLKRAATSTDKQHTLTSSTETVTTTHTHIDGVDGFNRFAVNVSAITGAAGYSIALQGSNDQSITNSTEPANWTTVATITPAATGETSSVFQNEFKYYRIVNTITGSSITYTAAIYETYVDRWIIHKTLELIFRDQCKIPGDVWEERFKSEQAMYNSSIQSYKFTVDSDDNNLVTKSDELNQSQQVTLTR